MAQLAFVGRGPGANSVAIQVRSVGAATDHLKRQGFSVADVVPDVLDSGRVATWRDFHFASSPVAGLELFFIEYPAVRHLSTRARVASLGTGAVLLTPLTGLPKAFQTKRSGTRVIALGLEVASIATSRPILSRRCEFRQRVGKSPQGRSLVLQASTSLELLLEFHEAASSSR